MMDIVKYIMNRMGDMLSQRSSFTSQWTDIKELVRPNSTGFSANATKGETRAEKIFDGTAIWSNEQLASGLHSFLTGPSSRWFDITIEGDQEGLSDNDLLWLEIVSDAIYAEYSDSEVNLTSSIHECYLDLGAFGTSVLYQGYDTHRRRLNFRTFPLGDCFISENANGLIDTMYRTVMWTRRQCQQEFGRLPPKMMDEQNADREYTIIHAVFPRDDYKSDMLVNTQMPYASVWICKDTSEKIKESGFREFPYHVPRWSKLSGEIYGRSPSMVCIPDVKMLNQIMKVILKGAQKQVDPPLMVPDDGFMLPINTSPASLIFYEAGLQELLKPLETKGRVDIGFEIVSDLRERIQRCFYVDLMVRAKKKERQSATEIMDERDEMLRLMSPMIGRIHTELLGPMIKRSFNLLARAGRFPQNPGTLDGRKLGIKYVSPAARAQIGDKANALQAFTAAVAPMAQIAPDIIDIFNTDAYATEMAKLRGVSRRVINSPDTIAQKREERKKQEQMQRDAEIGVQTAKASKDMAYAAATPLGGQ